MISIGPDPAHPRGGYALVTLPEGAIAGETTEVAVYDNYSERFLGEAGWQPTRVLFGPYALRREGGQLRLVIGPEIVNQIEEYANVRLIVGDVEEDIGWPDDIVPAPGAARIGGIMGTARAQKATRGGLTAKIPEPPAPEPSPEPVRDTRPAPEREEDDGTEDDDAEAPAGGNWARIGGLLVMVLLAVGLAYWLLHADGAPPAAPTPPLAEAPDTCGIDALAALGGFAAQAEALRGCAGQATADTALSLVERAAAAGDAQALLLFGIVYDAEARAEVIEDQIGLTFDDTPATAADYYARAVAAGSQEAVDRLAALCTRMAGMTDTLARGAVADHCAN